MTVTLVTGATSGIGRAAAVELARRGHHVLVHGRRSDAVEEVVAEARAVGRADGLLADLADPEALAGLVPQVRAHVDRVDVLVHNAGLILPRRTLTPEGLEATFAVNHLSVFRLTAWLLPLLADGGRVIVTSSRSHREGRLVIDDLQRERRPWSSYGAYADSKLANLLFVKEAALRLLSRGLVVHAVHPGAVATGWGQDEPTFLGWLMTLARPLRVLRTPEQGAATTVFVATASEALESTGLYWADSRPVRTTAAAVDPGLARALWEASVALSPGLPAWPEVP